jgi:hypothetical protein
MQKSVPTDTKVFRITHSSDLLCASSASSFGSPTPSFLFFSFSFLYQLSRACFYMFPLLTFLQVFHAILHHHHWCRKKELAGSMLRNADRKETTYPSL